MTGRIEAGFRAWRAASRTCLAHCEPMRLRPRTHTPLREVFHTLFVAYQNASAGRPDADGRAGLLL